MLTTTDEHILVIAAHPDDEILGCAGIISKYKDKARISVVIVGEGTTCRSQWNERDIRDRQEASRKALNDIVGSPINIVFGDAPCGMFNNYMPEITKCIELGIELYKPTIVLTHYLGDTNLDHRAVYDATRIATRPYLRNGIHSVYMYEVISSTDRSDFRPNLYVRLSDEDVIAKCKAMECFETEKSHNRSGEGIVTLAKYRGQHIGQQFAEAFMVERIVL